MKILKLGAGVLGAFVVIAVAVVAMRPDHQHVERTKLVAAAPGDVFPIVNDFTRWGAWSPWADIDPNQKVAISDPSSGKGAWYTWEGNDDIGKGRMEITTSTTDQKMVEKLTFIEPFATEATITFTFEPEGDKTKVVWAYDEDCGFMSKAAGLVMDMDQMLGADFEKGLGRLAPLAETAAQTRLAAEAKAREEAALAAAAAPPADGVVATDAAAPAAK